jgi:uncharacterized protein (DUF305 family)
MPGILATQEAEIRRMVVWKSAWASSLQDPISKNHITKKKGLVKWHKVQALSSNPSTAKKKKK